MSRPIFNNKSGKFLAFAVFLLFSFSSKFTNLVCSYRSIFSFVVLHFSRGTKDAAKKFWGK